MATATTMTTKTNNITKLVTHDGTFHTDDVFAAAALSLLLAKKKKKFLIIRTRDPRSIADADYVFDVGGVYQASKNRFDHHQASFKEKRKNGLPYSSFGLVWKKFGRQICDGEEVKNYIDKLLVEQIDATDNGLNVFKPITAHAFNYDISSVTASFLPVWGEKKSAKFFRNAVKFTTHILKKEIRQFGALVRAKKIINQAYKGSKNKQIVILKTDIPRYLADIATEEYKNMLYLVFQHKKNWKVLTVRKKAGSFANKKNLPRSWAGLTGRQLQRVTGVPDAVFCHRGLFLAVAKSKAGAIKLAELALLKTSAKGRQVVPRT